jgi:hypothetical protein
VFFVWHIAHLGDVVNGFDPLYIISRISFDTNFLLFAGFRRYFENMCRIFFGYDDKWELLNDDFDFTLTLH